MPCVFDPSRGMQETQGVVTPSPPAGTHDVPGRQGLRRMSGALEDLYVRRVGALGPDLGVVADLGTLGQRLEAAARDAAVVDEQVLALIVGRDEPEALVVAEPLNGSGCHWFPPGRLCAAKRGRCLGQ